MKCQYAIEHKRGFPYIVLRMLRLKTGCWTEQMNNYLSWQHTAGRHLAEHIWYLHLMLLAVCSCIMTSPVPYVVRYRRTSEEYIVGCVSSAMDSLLVKVNGRIFCLQLLRCCLRCMLSCVLHPQRDSHLSLSRRWVPNCSCASVVLSCCRHWLFMSHRRLSNTSMKLLWSGVACIMLFYSSLSLSLSLVTTSY